MIVYGLQAEQRTEPLGLGEPKPRLSARGVYESRLNGAPHLHHPRLILSDQGDPHETT